MPQDLGGRERIGDHALPLLCPDHRPVIAGARASISGHRRRKTIAAITTSYSTQCPDCVTENRRHTR